MRKIVTIVLIGYFLIIGATAQDIEPDYSVLPEIQYIQNQINEVISYLISIDTSTLDLPIYLEHIIDLLRNQIYIDLADIKQILLQNNQISTSRYEELYDILSQLSTEINDIHFYLTEILNGDMAAIVSFLEETLNYQLNEIWQVIYNALGNESWWQTPDVIREILNIQNTELIGMSNRFDELLISVSGVGDSMDVLGENLSQILGKLTNESAQLTFDFSGDYVDKIVFDYFNGSISQNPNNLPINIITDDLQYQTTNILEHIGYYTFQNTRILSALNNTMGWIAQKVYEREEGDDRNAINSFIQNNEARVDEGIQQLNEKIENEQSILEEHKETFNEKLDKALSSINELKDTLSVQDLPQTINFSIYGLEGFLSGSGSDNPSVNIDISHVSSFFNFVRAGMQFLYYILFICIILGFVFIIIKLYYWLASYLGFGN